MINKKILITGAAGFLGSNLIKDLYLNNRIIGVDVIENNLYHLRLTYDITAEVGAIEDATFITNVFAKYKPDIVIHCAAHKHVISGEQNPVETINVNINGTLNVFSACEAFGVDTCIFISTDKAETPANVYGQTKAVGENLVKAFSMLTKCRYIGVRFCNLYGSTGSVVPIFIENIQNNMPITITKGSKRYFIDIADAIDCIHQVYSDGVSGNIYMTKKCKEISIEDIARKIAKDLGKDFDSLAVTYKDCPEYEKLDESYLDALHVRILP